MVYSLVSGYCFLDVAGIIQRLQSVIKETDRRYSLSVYRRQFPTHKPLYLLLNRTSRAIDVQNSSARSTLRNYIFNQRRRYYLRHRSFQSTEIVFAVYIRSLYQPLRFWNVVVLWREQPFIKMLEVLVFCWLRVDQSRLCGL